MNENNITIVMWAYNEKEMVQNCLTLMKDIKDIIIVDNGSSDGLDEWLAEQPHSYVCFDEGMQGYGRLLNLVTQNFALNDIVIFMQPRYVLGKNCIDKIINVLHENKQAGIVGPVSNGFAPPQYLEMEEMDKLWDIEESCKENEYQVVGVSAGIWGISKETLEQIGKFDEELVEPENVILDYQLKMIERGYKHIYTIPQAIVFDIFGGNKLAHYQKMLRKNDKDILRKKWKMNYFNIIPNKGIVEFINKEKSEFFNILEIGCDLGSTLLEIKHQFPNCGVYGIEINERAALIAEHLLDVKHGDIEKDGIPFEEKFDFIVFGDVLEHLRNPYEVIRNCRKHLNKNGCIIANIPNLMHISVMEQLVNGRFKYEDMGLLDRTHNHFFTYIEIISMFETEGYTVDNIESYKTNINAEQEKLKKSLLQLSNRVDSFMYDTYQYLVRARKVRINL